MDDKQSDENQDSKENEEHDDEFIRITAAHQLLIEGN
jgi:hypothetical protein